MTRNVFVVIYETRKFRKAEGEWFDLQGQVVPSRLNVYLDQRAIEKYGQQYLDGNRQKRKPKQTKPTIKQSSSRELEWDDKEIREIARYLRKKTDCITRSNRKALRTRQIMGTEQAERSSADRINIARNV